MRAGDRPPRALAWLAAHIVGRAADDALEDLDDRYGDRLRAGTRTDANRWYVRQVIGFLVVLPFARWPPRSHRPSRSVGGWLEELSTDLRRTLRGLTRDGSWTTATISTLAIGIGAATAVYAVFNHILFRPVPGIDEASRLVSVYVRPDPSTPVYTTATHAHLVAMRAMPAFAGLAGYRTRSLPMQAGDGDPRLLQVTSVSLGYFDLLGVEAAAGRLFRPDEYERPGPAIAVISERLWRTAFGGSAPVDTKISILGRPVVVIGVARRFRGLARVGDEDVWLPIAADAELNLHRGGEYRWDRMVGRLHSATAVTAAREQAAAAFERIGRIESGSRPFTAVVYSGLTDGFGQSEQVVRELFWLAISGAGLLLLLGCLNGAGMLISRNLRRQRDLALKAAIGASGARIVRELIVEASAISALAGVGGLGLAALLAAMFRGERLLSYLPTLTDLDFDWRVCGFAVAAATMTVLLAGALPALLATRAAPGAPLKGSPRRAPIGRLRIALTATQVALSFALLASAGVLAASLVRLRGADLGFDPERLLTVAVQPRLAGRDDASLFREVERRLAAEPGIGAVGIAASPPIGSMLRTEVAASPDAAGDAGILRYVSSDYFRAMRIPVVAGRTFTGAEAIQQDAGGPAIVDALLAEHLFHDTPPLGRTIHFRWRGSTAHRRVVGVVGATSWAIGENRRPTVYLPLGDTGTATFHVRAAVPTGDAVRLIRRVVRDVEPRLPADVQTMEAQIDLMISQPRVQARLAAVFALLALGLAIAGVYSAVSGAVLARTREFGVRMALGATRAKIRHDVAASAIRTTTLGLAGGMMLYLWLSRYLESQLHHVSALDPGTIAGTCGLLLVVATGAASLPARRATRIDPAITLRTE